MSITTPSYRPDPYRTGISLAYTNRQLIADQVLPRVQVEDYTFAWNRFNLADRFTIPDTVIGRAGMANTVEFGITEESGTVVDHALATWVPQVDVERGAKTGYNPIDTTSVTLTELLLLRHEKEVADTVFTLANYPVTNRQTLSGTDQFSNAASKPYDLIMTALEAMIMRPNILVMNRPGFRALCNNVQIITKTATTGSGTSSTVNADGPTVTAQQIADLFEVDQVIVGNARVNTADFGATPVLSRCWGNHMAMLYRGGNIVSATPNDITFGFVAEFRTREAFTKFEPERGRLGSTYTRVAETKRPIIAASDVGYFLQNVI